MTDYNDTKNWIKKCEKFKNKLYKCSADKWTIGWGRNIEENGISVDEAELMFENDFKRCLDELNGFTWFIKSPQSVKSGLLNMCFNLGLTRLLTFRKMIDALIYKDYAKAAQEALNSKWASQVGDRAKDIAVMIREGK